MIENKMTVYYITQIRNINVMTDNGIIQVLKPCYKAGPFGDYDAAMLEKSKLDESYKYKIMSSLVELNDD